MSRRNMLFIAGAALGVVGLMLVLAVSRSRAVDLIGLVLILGGGVVGLAHTKVPTIAWRELAGYFVSPVAYILIAAYLFVVALVFNIQVIGSGEAVFEPLFGGMTYLILFLCPLITMRLLSEEARSGTLETMLTVPVTDFELTIGKFLGAFAFFAAAQVPTLVFVYVVARRQAPDYGTIAASYVGLLLLGGLLISMGLLISALTRNQVIAAFVGIVSMFGLLIVSDLGRMLGGALGNTIAYIGAGYHYLDFTRGILASQHVLYYIIASCLFLFFSVRAVESHKWR